MLIEKMESFEARDLILATDYKHESDNEGAAIGNQGEDTDESDDDNVELSYDQKKIQSDIINVEKFLVTNPSEFLANSRTNRICACPTGFGGGGVESKRGSDPRGPFVSHH